MNEELCRSAYEICIKFLKLLNSGDHGALLREFGISKPIFDEIEESLTEYFGSVKPMALAPYELAFERKNGQRSFFDIYKMDAINHFGVECVIWVDGKAGEPILHAEFEQNGGDLKFYFKYLGS